MTSLFLQRFSGVLFYLLGASFFVGYLLFRNSIGGPWPAWWMQVADLPLAFVAVGYGGSSFYRTIHRAEHTSWAKVTFITVVMLIVFAVLFVMNFWEVLGLPAQPIS